MARTTGGLSLEVDGLLDTLQAVRGLESDLRSQANAELRAAAGRCAQGAQAELARAAASSGVPVARRVAASIRVKSDRLPVLTIGGNAKVGTGKSGQAGRLVWGSEQGPKSDPNRFGVEPNSAGYWIAPAVARFADGDGVTIYKRAVYELLHKYGLT